MSDNTDQLAILGQQVLDTLTATYNPQNDPSVALALHPGQALADNLVQNGVTNPLRLSGWLEDQYDYPLYLKRSDASSISASSIGSLTAKSAYLAMIPWAQPSVPANAPAYARISAMIAEARKDLGDNPATLPFGCEPTDFAESGSTVWHIFDQKITSATTTSTQTQRVIDVNPHLWKMRALTSEVIANLTPVSSVVERRKAFRAELAVMPRAEAVTTLRVQPRFAAAIKPEPVHLESTPSLGNAAASFTMSHQNVALRSIASATFRRTGQAAQVLQSSEALTPATPTVRAASTQVQFDASLLDKIGTIQLHDLVETPAVLEITSSGSELHVHFEYCMLNITRRISGTKWWHSELIEEDDWYVPGMKRGDMVPASTDEAYAHYIPLGLILVRNVEFSGSWTAEARATLQNAVSFFGPFLMQAPTASTSSTSNTEQVSVLGAGVQVIGELCAPLPPLPPADDPGAPALPAG